MQWQFRKALQSFQGYKRRSANFKNDIQNGDQGTLDMVARQVELILADRNEKIVPKVLALRFVRDIMVLGLESIIKRVQKLVPHLTKICSHQLGSADTDRGQTYFHYHPAYTRLTNQQQKQQIDTLGSTYLILSLESVLHWAQWIPHDSSGKQSIYKRAYQSLVERGVKFPNTFHYYKQSDTEKFKNMYKMEFFTDSYDSGYSQTPSEQPSQSEIDARQSRGSLPAPRSKVKEQLPKINAMNAAPPSGQDYTGQAQGLRTVSQFMSYLNKLKQTKSRKMGDVREIHRKVLELQESNKKNLSKQDAKWVQNFIVNFSLLHSSIINYDEFINRCLVQDINIEASQDQLSLSLSKKQAKSMSKVNKVHIQNSRVSDVANHKMDELLRQQQIQFKTRINGMLIQLEQKNNQFAILQSNAEKQKARLIEDYQSRIGLIKTEVKKGNQDRGAFERELEKDNQRLRAKTASLQEQLATITYNTARQRDIETQRNQLLTRVKKLEMQNQKYTHQRSGKKDIQKQLIVLQSLVRQKDAALQRMKNQLKKSQKQCQNYYDQAGLYKTQLINERNKHEYKLQSATKSKESLEMQNRGLKEKMLQCRKIIDLKDIQILNLKDELKRYQSKLKDIAQRPQTRNNQNFKRSNLKTAMSPSKDLDVNIHSNDAQLRFNNYQDLWGQLRPANKQLFVRLCRCALKKKDILFKENELQVGIISQLVAQDRVKFVLHFTNTSEKQIENISLQHNIAQSYLSTLEYKMDNKYIFCIQPQQQQKVTIIVNNKESPFLKERAIIELAYDKNGTSFSTNIFLPFLIPKFFDFFKPKQLPPDRTRNIRETIKLKYNKKMLPKPSSLISYFQGLQQTNINQFQMQAFHRETDLSIRVVFMVSPDTQSLVLEATLMREKANQKQKYIFEELVSFLEAAFKK